MIQFDKLNQLAKHLIAGELGYEEFDFNHYNESTLSKGFDKQGCGTSGCAIGEMPFVFSEDWHFAGTSPALKKGSANIIAIDAKRYLGLNSDQYESLFIPNGEPLKGDTRRMIGPAATAKRVGNHILKFIKTMKSETVN